VAQIPATWLIDGARVRELRMAKMMTLPELAAKAGVARRTLVDAESGKRGARPDTIRCLAGALGVAPEELRPRTAVPVAQPPVAPPPAPPLDIPPPKLPARTRLDTLADLVRARGAPQAPVVIGKARIDVLDPVVLQNLFARHAAFDGAKYVVAGKVDAQRALSVAEARALRTKVGVGARYRVVVDVVASATKETLDVTVHATDAKLAGALQAKMGKPVRVVVSVRVVGKNDARVVSLFASARTRAWALVGVRLG
jgi:transcriptional regulator with XRE-family HTH domain